MKKRQFRYILPFLILALFVFGTVVDSQETTEQSTEEPKSTEQSQTEQITEEPKSDEQSQSEDKTEEPEPIEPTSEGAIPSESQLRTLNENIKNLQLPLEALIHSSNNSFQYFVLTIIVLIILFSAFVILWGGRLLRQQRSILANSKQRLERKLNDNQQGLESRIQIISQQGKDNTEKLEETVSIYSTISNELVKFQSVITRYESRFDNIDRTIEELKVDRETPTTPDSSVVDEIDVESTVLEAQERAEELTLAYKSGEPIDLDNIDTTIPGHNKVLDLNWVACRLREWITELEQFTAENKELIQTLKYAELTIKEKLKTIREKSTLALKPPNLETDLESDDIRTQSIAYPAQLEGMLIGYELARKLDEEEYDRYIKQFVKDNLFNNVAKYIPLDQLHEQLDKFLQLAEYEIIPVEVGVTEADSRVHDIQGSKQTDVKRGTVAEVITPGLMQKTDNYIVQKPVVIRGE